MKYKAVIFDLDGTLIDSREDIALAANRVLEAEGYPVWPIEKYGLFMGNGLKHLVKCALEPVTGDDEIIEHCRQKLLEDYGRHYLVKTRYYQGIDKVLDFLKANRIKTAVLSNKPHEITGRIVSELFAPWPFTVVQGAEEGLPMKPDPEALRGVCRRLGVEPAEALYVGDSEVDIRTARAAGMDCVACAWGYRDRKVLEKEADRETKFSVRSEAEVAKVRTPGTSPKVCGSPGPLPSGERSEPSVSLLVCGPPGPHPPGERSEPVPMESGPLARVLKIIDKAEALIEICKTEKI